tara:strand:- start:217 stop:483 length:267 start_codon:yes stop_codon:yes gene_type:complete
VIVYLKFLDHSSGSNSWLTKDEFKQECVIEECEVVGFLEFEDDKAYYLTTMRSSTDLGSGHVILKSCVTYIKRYPKKPVLKPIQVSTK